MPYFLHCPKCNKPYVCKENLRKLRIIVIPCSVGTGLLGVALLPSLGFGLGGIAAGSAAAAVQSSIGAVAAGSLFAGLQSLGATGLGMLLFGSVGAAIPLLSSVAVKLGWCDGTCVEKKCSDSTQISKRLIISNQTICPATTNVDIRVVDKGHKFIEGLIIRYKGYPALGRIKHYHESAERQKIVMKSCSNININIFKHLRKVLSSIFK